MCRNKCQHRDTDSLRFKHFLFQSGVSAAKCTIIDPLGMNILLFNLSSPWTAIQYIF